MQTCGEKHSCRRNRKGKIPEEGSVPGVSEEQQGGHVVFAQKTWKTRMLLHYLYCFIKKYLVMPILFFPVLLIGNSYLLSLFHAVCR